MSNNILNKTTLTRAVTSGDSLYLTDGTGDYNVDGDALSKFAYGVACSDLTSDLATGTSVGYFRMPHDAENVTIKASVLTAPVGSTIIVDMNVNGSSVLSTKLTIDAGEKTSVTAATPYVLTSDSLSADDEITFDIDQVGSTTAGKGLIVWVIGNIK